MIFHLGLRKTGKKTCSPRIVLTPIFHFIFGVGKALRVWFWVEVKGFEVVHAFRANYYLFTSKLHLCVVLMVHVARHMTRKRVSPAISTY